MNKIIGLLVFALAGCVAQPPVGFSSGGGGEPVEEDPPWLACATDNPCVDWAYCDELGASEEPMCHHEEDLSCRYSKVEDGLDCFPTADVAVGHCFDGRCL